LENNNSGILTDEQNSPEITEASPAEDSSAEIQEKPSDDESALTEQKAAGTDDAPDDETIQPGIGQKPDPEEESARRQFIIRVIAVVLTVLGVVMLISGIALRKLDQESRKVPDKEQMPQEYIDEFFSDENYKPSIEEYIEPEA